MRTDDPVMDMEYDQMDFRPLIGRCITCGAEIRGQDATHFGDAYWRIFGWDYCEDCGQDRLKREFFVSGE